jgi:hypothetical protein
MELEDDTASQSRKQRESQTDTLAVHKHIDMYSCVNECTEGGIATLSQLRYLHGLGVSYPSAISKQEAGGRKGGVVSLGRVAQKRFRRK